MPIGICSRIQYCLGTCFESLSTSIVIALCQDSNMFLGGISFINYKDVLRADLHGTIFVACGRQYMERFEQRALESFPCSIPRFVDDTFVVVDKKDHTLFFDHINSCAENIKFTQEEVQDNTLAFLDTAIHREHMQRFSEHHAARCTANPDTNKI